MEYASLAQLVMQELESVQSLLLIAIGFCIISVAGAAGIIFELWLVKKELRKLHVS